jgi:hypothetical protein
MTALGVASPSRAFAAPHAGDDYFTTEAHYLSLASRVVAALRRGSAFILLTGDPPPDPLLFSRALEIAAAWWYTVIVFARGTEICGSQLRAPARLVAASGGSGVEAAEPPPALSPLLVIGDADGLSDEQVANIYEALTCRDGITPAVVLLARTAFFGRQERSNPRLIGGGLTACFRLQDLGREEIETFIRHQRCSSDAAKAFRAEVITAIADISRGDPAIVNHLARLTLEVATLVDCKGDEKEIGEARAVRAAASALGKERRTIVEPGRSQSPRRGRRRPVRTLRIALLSGLVIGGILVVPRDRLQSLVLQESLRAIPSLDFAAWINPGRDMSAPVGADNTLRAPALAALPIGAEQPVHPQPEPVFAALIPEHPTGAATDVSSDEKVSLRPTPPTAALEAAATTAESRPTPAETRLSIEEIAALMARGDAFIVAGDISSARLFYERAVAAGDGRAALRMGVTFDPAFLDQTNFGSTFRDPQQALSWYRRARDLGEAEAARRVGDLKR